jgi:diacylglycerol kinase family enzyme
VTVADTGSFGAGSRLRLARYAHGLRSGRLTDQPGVRHARGAAIELTLTRAATLNVDGELVSGDPRVRVTVEPSAFTLVVPDQPGADSPSK